MGTVNCPRQETEVSSTPTRLVENVVITTKGLHDRNVHILDGTTVENKVKLILIDFLLIICGESLINEPKYNSSHRITYQPQLDLKLPDGFDKMLTVHPETAELKLGKDQTVKVSSFLLFLDVYVSLHMSNTLYYNYYNWLYTFQVAIFFF